MALEAITGLGLREKQLVRTTDDDPVYTVNGALNCATNFEIPLNLQVN